MRVDVQNEIVIDRPRAEVAAWTADPDNAPRWRGSIKGVQWRSPKPLSVGSRIAFLTPSLGLPLAYNYRFPENVPGERLVMRTEDGPFALETIYEWEDAGEGATRVTLRTHGDRTQGSKLAGRIIARAMRRADREDLKRLKAILEAHDDG